MWWLLKSIRFGLCRRMFPSERHPCGWEGTLFTATLEHLRPRTECFSALMPHRTLAHCTSHWKGLSCRQDMRMHHSTTHWSLMAQPISITPVLKELFQLRTAGNSQGMHFCLLSRKPSSSQPQAAQSSSSLGHLLLRDHCREKRRSI